MNLRKLTPKHLFNDVEIGLEASKPKPKHGKIMHFDSYYGR